MEENRKKILSDEEKDALQEIMNIAFGKASSDLAEAIDIYVVLGVPYVKVLPATSLPNYMENEVKKYESIDIVRQHFRGKFRGIAFLIFSSGSGKKLVSLFQGDSKQHFDSEPMDSLEKETLVEVGNILIGACVGKLSELLGDVVTYSPPVAVIGNTPKDSVPKEIFDPYRTALIFNTVFRFEKKNISGFLFIVTSDESIDWLKKALVNFIGQYE